MDNIQCGDKCPYCCRKIDGEEELVAVYEGQESDRSFRQVGTIHNECVLDNDCFGCDSCGYVRPLKELSIEDDVCVYCLQDIKERGTTK